MVWSEIQLFHDDVNELLTTNQKLQIRKLQKRIFEFSRQKSVKKYADNYLLVLARKFKYLQKKYYFWRENCYFCTLFEIFIFFPKIQL